MGVWGLQMVSLHKPVFKPLLHLGCFVDSLVVFEDTVVLACVRDRETEARET